MFTDFTPQQYFNKRYPLHRTTHDPTGALDVLMVDDGRGVISKFVERRSREKLMRAYDSMLILVVLLSTMTLEFIQSIA